MKYLERTIVDLGSCYEMIITNVIRIAGHNWFRLMMLTKRTYLVWNFISPPFPVNELSENRKR